MPPIQKKTEAPEGFLKVGSLINIDRGGRCLQNLEVLAVDDKFIKVRWDQFVSPLTEVVLIPIAECIIGLVGER